jgi:hypothetical protein
VKLFKTVGTDNWLIELESQELLQLIGEVELVRDTFVEWAVEVRNEKEIDKRNRS